MSNSHMKIPIIQKIIFKILLTSSVTLRSLCFPSGYIQELVENSSVLFLACPANSLANKLIISPFFLHQRNMWCIQKVGGFLILSLIIHSQCMLLWIYILIAWTKSYILIHLIFWCISESTCTFSQAFNCSIQQFYYLQTWNKLSGCIFYL